MRSKLYLLLGFGLLTPAWADEKPPEEVTVSIRAISLESPILGYGYRNEGKITPLVIAPDFFTQEFTYRGNPHFELLPLTATLDPAEIAKLQAKHPTGKPSALSIQSPFAPHTIDKPGDPDKSLLKIGPDARKSTDAVRSADAARSNDAQATNGPSRTGDPFRSADAARSNDATQTAGPRTTDDPIRSGNALKSNDPRGSGSAQKTLDPDEKKKRRATIFVPVSIDPPKKIEKGDENKPLAWIDLPTTPGPHHLILLVNAGDPKGGIMAIDDAPGAFRYGTIRFYNLCPHPIEIHIPGSQTRIDSRGSMVVSPAALDGTYFEGSIHSLSKTDQKEALSYSFRYFQQNDLRTLYFIIPSPESEGQVLLKGVEDRYRPPETSPAKR